MLGGIQLAALAPFWAPASYGATAVRRMRKAVPLDTRALGGAVPVTTGLAIDPTGQFIASCGDDARIRTWNVADGRCVRTLEQHAGWVRLVHFLPNGQHLVSAGDDGRLLLWDFRQGELVQEIMHAPRGISMAAISPRGDLAALCAFGERSVDVIDMVHGRRVTTLEGCCRDTRAMSFDREGGKLITGGRDGVVRIWDVPNAVVIGDPKPHRKRIRCIDCSPNGEFIATAGEDGQVCIVPLRSPDEAYVLGRTSARVLCGVFCGVHHFVTGGSDNSLRVWSLSEGREVENLQGHRGSISALACHQQVLVSAAYDATMDVWRLLGPGDDSQWTPGNSEG